MANLLVIVEKEFSGERWSNTHCLRTSLLNEQASDEDMIAIGAGSPLTAATTDAAPATVHNPLQAILSFERQMHRGSVQFVNVYVTDGKRNFDANGNPVPGNVFWTSGLAFSGLQPSPADGVMAPGAVTLMVSRNARGFSSRKGRLFIRGLVTETEIRMAGPKLLDFQDAASRASYENILAAAVTNSDLAGLLDVGGTPDFPDYAIPEYERADPTAIPPVKGGQLIDSHGCAGLTVAGLAIRQVKRGRKEK